MKTLASQLTIHKRVKAVQPDTALVLSARFCYLDVGSGTVMARKKASRIYTNFVDNGDIAVAMEPESRKDGEYYLLGLQAPQCRMPARFPI